MILVTILFAGAGLLLMLGVAVIKKLMTDEMAAYIRVLSARMVRSAASELPEDWRERCERKWLGKLASYRDRPISGLVYSVRVRRSARAPAYVLDATAPDVIAPVEPSPQSLIPPDSVGRIINRLVALTQREYDELDPPTRTLCTSSRKLVTASEKTSGSVVKPAWSV